MAPNREKNNGPVLRNQVRLFCAGHDEGRQLLRDWKVAAGRWDVVRKGSDEASKQACLDERWQLLGDMEGLVKGFPSEDTRAIAASQMTLEIVQKAAQKRPVCDLHLQCHARRSHVKFSVRCRTSKSKRWLRS